MSYWGRKKGTLKRKVKRKIIPGYGKSTRQKLGLKRRSSSKRNRSTSGGGGCSLSAVQWFFCIVFFIGGFGFFSQSILAGLGAILTGIALCPLVSIPTLYRTVIVIFLMLVTGFAMPESEKQEEPSRSASFFDENGERAYYPTTTTTSELTTTTTTKATTTTAAETTTEETSTVETTTVVITTEPPTQPPTDPPVIVRDNARDYVINTNTGKFHYSGCPSVKDIKDGNRMDYHGTAEEIEAMGYVKCKRCF